VHVKKDCPLFIIFNHNDCCLWVAILNVKNSPEKLTNGCPENCVWFKKFSENKEKKQRQGD